MLAETGTEATLNSLQTQTKVREKDQERDRTCKSKRSSHSSDSSSSSQSDSRSKRTRRRHHSSSEEREYKRRGGDRRRSKERSTKHDTSRDSRSRRRRRNSSSDSQRSSDRHHSKSHRNRDRDYDRHRDRRDRRSRSRSPRDRSQRDYDRNRNHERNKDQREAADTKSKDQRHQAEAKDKQQSDSRAPDRETAAIKAPPKQEGPPAQRNAFMPAAAGGVYIPPFKMRAMLEELKNKEKTSMEHQKYMWEQLRKSINGIVNKVNTSNIQNIILELFNENLLRGKGLLARAIMKAQMASPNFSHVYSALIAVINTKLPDLVRLIINRYIVQFQRAYKRNNKIVCMATTRMLAHFVNQQVVNEILGLELLTLMLENPTEDSVEIAADFMIECGQVLTDVTPAGVNAIFERFRTILHEGEIAKKVQYTIENLFAIRKTRFAEHPGVIPELDLVEEEDKITHNVSLEETEEVLETAEETNVFQYDPNYEQTEAEWDEIKKEILGEVEDTRMNKEGAGIIRGEDEESDEAEEPEEDKNQILDFTEQDLVNLRRVIYLVIMSSVDYEECCHKLLKLNFREGQEVELCNMILECNMQERTYLKFFGHLGQRLCQINEVYQKQFHDLFMRQYLTVHRLEINKLRNAAKFFAHLLYTNEIMEWTCLSCIRLTEQDTSSSSRIFVKILFQELAENLGMENLKKKLNDESLKPHLENLFPKDSVQNARFSINFFTSIGLGALTEELREFLQQAPKLLIEKKYAELLAQAQQSDSSDSDSSSSDSDSSSGSSQSDSESEDSSVDKRNKKKRR